MALADLLRNVGAPPTWRDIYWPQFEECVLEFVQAGCDRLINDQRRSAAWQEDHYTHALCEHLDGNSSGPLTLGAILYLYFL